MQRIEPSVAARDADPDLAPRPVQLPADDGSGRLGRRIALVVLLIAVVAGAWYWFAQRTPEPPPPPPRVEAPPPPPAPAAPAIEHPLPSPPDTAPLPALAASDSLLVDTLNGLIGARAVQQLLVTKDFVRRVVAFVDNLPREKLPRSNAPLQPAAGAPRVSGKGETLAFAAANGARYAPYVALAEAVDPAALVAAYVRLYPLFQQAYEELGYPQRYFNDRLMQVIDHLLETPEVTGPLRLTQPKVSYEFADPRLEALSAGQKALLRTGHDNAARLKARLGAIRAELRRSSAAR